jgi:hypothetical protein
MGNHNENTDQNVRTVFFFILFSLFVLSSSDIQGIHYSYLPKHSEQTELVFGGISSHHSEIILNTEWFSDPHKYYELVPLYKGFIPLSIPYKILDYNQKIAQNLIAIQKARLSRGPLLALKFYFKLCSNKDDDLPVLS